LQVPQEWVERYDEYQNNFHLTHAQLNAVARGDGEWETQYASVCNSVLPFDRCAAHFGSQGWGTGVGSLTALQVRIYEVASSPEALERAIEEEGQADAKRWTKLLPELNRDTSPLWKASVLSFPLWFEDYGGVATVEFRYRRVGERTFVFVFMYEAPGSQVKAIEGILDSFRLPDA
jgi:hypothetical protein